MYPPVDEHLVEPEVTRDEIIGGHRIVAFPANPPHARQHTRLDYVLLAHTAPGYTAATDLLTRHDEDRLNHWLDRAALAATADEVLQR